jgi:activating signal cointegrator complex subunit 1
VADLGFGASEGCYNDEVCDVDFDVEEYSGGFRVRLDIPSAYYAYIIGKRGETKRRIEVETKTQIRIPKMGEKGEIGKL